LFSQDEVDIEISVYREGNPNCDRVDIGTKSYLLKEYPQLDAEDFE